VIPVARRVIPALAAAMVCPLLLAGADGPYRLGRTTQLGYASNTHLYDPVAHRLYSAAVGGVYAVDTVRRRSLGVLARVPLGTIALDAERGELFALARNESRMTVVDVSTGKIARQFDAPAGLRVAHDPASGTLYYFGSQPVAFVADPQRGEQLAGIRLDGAVSSFAVDPPRHRVLVRLFDRDLIQVIDTRERRVTVSWPLRADGRSAIAVDEASGRVFVSAQKSVVMLDGLSGKPLGSFATGDLPVGVAYDPDTKLIAAVWGQRFVTIARVVLLGIEVLQTVDLRSPGRNVYVEPGTHNLIVTGTFDPAVAFGADSPAASNRGRTTALFTLRYRPE
jgi:hypothetical protein